VLVAVRNTIHSQRKHVTASFVDTNVDYLWVKLNNYQKNKRTLYLGAFYFRPNTSALTYAKVEEMILEVLMHGNDVLIVGDFNIRQYKPDIDKNEVFTDDRLNELISIINTAGLHSYNTVFNHQNNTLDLVLSNLDPIVVHRGSSLIDKPDVYHPPLEIVIHPGSRLKFCSKKLHTIHQNSNTVQRLNFAKGDFLKLYRMVEAINWSPLYAMKDVNHAANFIQEKLYNAVSQTVPMYKNKTKLQHPPWFTRDILKTIQKKKKE